MCTYVLQFVTCMHTYMYRCTVAHMHKIYWLKLTCPDRNPLLLCDMTWHPMAWLLQFNFLLNWPVNWIQLIAGDGFCWCYWYLGPKPKSSTFTQILMSSSKNLILYNSKLVVTGDVNSHKAEQRSLHNASFDMKQLVTWPRYTHNSCLDLVIKGDDWRPVTVIPNPSSVSDH